MRSFVPLFAAALAAGVLVSARRLDAQLRGTVLGVVTMLAPPLPAGYSGYSALVATPAGGLPPLATSTIAGIAQGSPQFSLRYGYLSNVRAPLGNPDVVRAGSGSQIAATATVPLSLGSTLSATVGVARASGAASTTGLVGSVAGDYRLLERRYGPADSTTRLTVGVNGEVGAGRSVVTGTLGVPIGVVVRGQGRGTRFVSFITPAIGIGKWSGQRYDVGQSARVLVGGGVGVLSPLRNLSASLGFQYVFIDRAQPQVGLAVSIGGR